MTIRYLLLFLLIGSLIFLVNSCARQSSPTGGPKDTIPPVLVESFPHQNEINVKQKNIELEFSEAIILANPKEQIIITPTTNKEYSVTAKKKTVIIRFEEPLKDSVTYSINFRDAVQDITEKNPVRNLQLAFSTGSYIDSLTIAGTVYNQLTGVPPKEATVAIHELNDTISIFKHKPGYLTKTNQQGQFLLKNLKAGTYTIYAVEDKNRNLLADSRSESYAFKAHSIMLPQDSALVNLGLVRLDARPLKMTSARPYGNYFNIKTGKNMDQFMLKSTQPGDTIVSSFGEDHANVRIYDTFDADSTLVSFTAIDSIGNQLDSNLYIKFNTREVKPDKYTVTQDKATLLQEKGDLEISFKFNKPTFLINTDSLLFAIDSANVIPLATGTLTWNHMTNELKITKKIDPALLKTAPAATATQKPAAGGKPKQDRTAQPNPGAPVTRPNPTTPPVRSDSTTLATKPDSTAVTAKPVTATPAKKPAAGAPAAKPKTVIKNQLIVARGTFISIDQDTAPKLEKEIKPIRTEDMGIIIAEVKTSAEHFIVQLLDKDFKPIKETTDAKKIRWEDVAPGDYRIRLIIDLNNNKKWDPGNYLKKEEPEPVFFYLNSKIKPENTTHVKANWEVGPLLITSE